MNRDIQQLFAAYEKAFSALDIARQADLFAEAFISERVIVVSQTLRQDEHPGVEVVRELSRSYLQGLRCQPGKDIWLFGGEELFHDGRGIRSPIDAL